MPINEQISVRSGGDFSPIPMGKYTVQIADVNPKVRFNKYKGEEEKVLNFQFTILDEQPLEEEGGTTRGRFLWHMMAPSMNPKAWLFKLAKAVYGRDLTKEEIAYFTNDATATRAINALCGKQVDVMVEQSDSKDGTAVFSNIISYSKTLRPLKPVEAKEKTEAVVEKATTPAPIFDDPLKGQGIDVLGEDPFGSAPVASSKTTAVAVEEILEEEDAEETPEELELKLKLAKAKAKAAKAKK